MCQGFWPPESIHNALLHFLQSRNSFHDLIWAVLELQLTWGIVLWQLSVLRLWRLEPAVQVSWSSALGNFKRRQGCQTSAFHCKLKILIDFHEAFASLHNITFKCWPSQESAGIHVYGTKGLEEGVASPGQALTSAKADSGVSECLGRTLPSRPWKDC